jgi:hypothetical protein
MLHLSLLSSTSNAGFGTKFYECELKQNLERIDIIKLRVNQIYHLFIALFDHFYKSQNGFKKSFHIFLINHKINVFEPVLTRCQFCFATMS